MTRRYESLDGMRGVCALMVATLHFDRDLYTQTLVGHALLNVDLFFVLSGFVIALVYEDRLRKGHPFTTFMKSRAARLLPIQIIGTITVALSYLALYLGGHLRADGVSLFAIGTALIYGLLLIHASLAQAVSIFPLGPGQGFPINPPLWSLQSEWIVNIIYGRILCHCKTPVLIALVIAAVTYLVFRLAQPPHNWETAIPFVFLPSFARAGFGFLAGVLIFRAHAAGVLQRLPSIGPEVIYAAWFTICFGPTIMPQPILEAVAAFVISPLAVLLLVCSKKSVPRPFLILGALSYPLYASHWAIVNIAHLWFPPVRHSPIFVIPLLAAALALAWMIDRLTNANSYWMTAMRCRIQRTTNPLTSS